MVSMLLGLLERTVASEDGVLEVKRLMRLYQKDMFHVDDLTQKEIHGV